MYSVLRTLILFTHYLVLGDLERVIRQADRQIQRWVIKVSSDLKGGHEGAESKLKFLNFLEQRTK
jgi:hypothetical protein